MPYQEVDVYAKEAGYVKDINVDYGSHVHKGQVMAILEVPELEAQLQQDKAAIKARDNEVMRAKNEVARAKAQHDVLHLQYTRLADVSKTKKGLVAQQEVDDAQSKDLAAESNSMQRRGRSRLPKARWPWPRRSLCTIRPCSTIRRSWPRSMAWSRNAMPTRVR